MTWTKMEARCQLLGCCQWMRGHTGYEDVANLNGCPKCKQNKDSAERKNSGGKEEEKEESPSPQFGRYKFSPVKNETLV